MNTTTVSRWGNSLAVRIPKAVMDNARFQEGDELELNVTAEGELLLRPARRPLTLEELLDGITPENCPSETAWGEARGKEAW